jgi:hypothetical protein
VSDSTFFAYIALLLISGILLAVLAFAGFGQAKSARIYDGIFAAGFIGYALYLLLVFDGGTFIIFYYAFIVPIVAVVRAVKARTARRAAEAAGYGQFPGTQPYAYVPPTGPGQPIQYAPPPVPGQPVQYAPAPGQWSPPAPGQYAPPAAGQPLPAQPPLPTQPPAPVQPVGAGAAAPNESDATFATGPSSDPTAPPTSTTQA